MIGTESRRRTPHEGPVFLAMANTVSRLVDHHEKQAKTALVSRSHESRCEPSMGRPTCARWRSRAPSLVRLGKALARRGRSRHATTHEATLTAENHLAYVEAFVLQLGALGQQAAILSLLLSCARGFRQHTIARCQTGRA